MESKRYEHFSKEAKQYKSICQAYKETGKPFVDPNFHPNMQIIETKVTIDDSIDNWVRVDDLYSAPLFQKDLIDPNFVQQGELGDCYFLAALSRIARQHELVQQLFFQETPNNELGKVDNSINIKCGAVVIIFHCFGRITPVLIDTLLPTKFGQLRFSSPSDRSKSAWFCLVEKAFAKLNGSYSNIEGGTLPNALYNLIGYYPVNKTFKDLETPEKLSKMSLFERLLKYQEQGSVMGTAIHISNNKFGVTEEELKEKGLISDHCYLIQKVRQNKKYKILCLRNPWGSHEWNGDWSDKSPLWTEELKKEFGWKDEDDGTFWMNEKDFFHYFTEVEVSKPLHAEWFSRSFYVQLTPGDHDGHNVEDEKAKILERPNFAFQVTDKIPDGEKCRFHILVEKRNKLIDEEKKLTYKPPRYCVYIAHNHGQKLNPKTLPYRNRFQMNSTLKTFTMASDVNGNDDILTIVINRLEKCNLIEDFYVQVFCKKNFKLYDIDKPENEIDEDEIFGPVIDNFSRKHPFVAPPLKKKFVKGRNVLGFGDVTDSVFDPSRSEELARYNQEIDKQRKRKMLSIFDDSYMHDDDEDDDDSKHDKDKELEDAKTEIQELKSQIEKMNREKVKALKAKDNEISNLKEENEKLKEMINKMKQAKDAELDEYKNLKENMNKNIQLIDEEIRNNKNEIEKLRNQVAENKKKNENLQSQLKKAKMRNENLESQLNKSKQKNDDLQNKLNEAQKRNDDLQNKLNEAQNKNENLESQLDKSKKRNDDLQNKLNEAQKRNENLESQLNEIKKSKEELTKQLDKSNEENSDENYYSDDNLPDKSNEENSDENYYSDDNLLDKSNEENSNENYYSDDNLLASLKDKIAVHTDSLIASISTDDEMPSNQCSNYQNENSDDSSDDDKHFSTLDSAGGPSDIESNHSNSSETNFDSTDSIEAVPSEVSIFYNVSDCQGEELDQVSNGSDGKLQDSFNSSLNISHSSTLIKDSSDYSDSDSSLHSSEIKESLRIVSIPLKDSIISSVCTPVKDSDSDTENSEIKRYSDRCKERREKNDDDDENKKKKSQDEYPEVRPPPNKKKVGIRKYRPKIVRIKSSSKI